MSMMQTEPTHRREQVRTGRTPRDCRYITIQTHWLLATSVYVVAVVDGTGRLADPQTLLTTPHFEKARRHANALYDSCGGGVPDPPTADFLERRYRRPADYPDHRRTLHTVGTIVELHEPRRNNKGRWYVRWYQMDSTDSKPRRRTFPIEQEARAFHAELSNLMRRA